MDTNCNTNYSTIQYNVLTGATASSIANIAPSAESGIPLISNGSSAQPSFNTMGVAGGGTGVMSFVPFAVICGGATSSGALQTVSGSGSVSQILTSNGSESLPSWTTVSGTNFFFQINVQTFTSGTAFYIPTSGMAYCTIECVGGGGGGGGAVSSASSAVVSGGSGGGGGGYARKTVSASTIGSSQLVTVGSGGTGGNTSGSNGSTGGTSFFGSIVGATGGGGGIGCSNASATVLTAGGNPGLGFSGDINARGGPGLAVSGRGGSLYYVLGGRGGYASFLGGATQAIAISTVGTAINGSTGYSYGGGGAGGVSVHPSIAALGGNGAPGIIIVTEYIT